MASLDDLLGRDPDPREPEYKAPPVHAEYDEGNGGYIQTAPLIRRPADDEILKQFGFNPDEVEIIGSPHISRWQQRSKKDDEPIWLQAYKFNIVPRLNGSMPDIEAMLKSGKVKKIASPPTTPNPYWFIFQAGDQQLGKKTRYGATEEICRRYLESVDKALEEFKGLKRFGIEGIQLSFPGDCIEGNMSQGGRNNGWLTELAITDQVKIFRQMLFHTVDAFAPLASQMIVTVVNGNHDDADRQLNQWPGAGWATHTAEAVFERLGDRPERFGHVEMQIPNKWRGAVATQVGDSVVATVHGHQWRKNGAMKWFEAQAANRHPAGGADVVQHGHHHEHRLESTASVYIIGSSTFEPCSDYWVDKHGTMARRGALTYLLRSGEPSHMSIV